MMSRRTRITILLLVFLALILLVIWFLYFLFSKPTVSTLIAEEPVIETVQEIEIIPSRSTISDQEIALEREVRNNSVDVVSASKTFVTRYGSYSNEADFGNLVDVLSLMSKDFAEKTQSFIDTAIAPEEYYGVTTSVITVNVKSKDDEKGTATVEITTQREEAIGSPQNTSVKYQDIVLTYVKEGGVWKVDSATWQ